MIYFDNAATGGFKPRAVTDAADTVLRYLSANPGRSGHRLSLAGAKMVNSTRDSVAKLFNANPDRVIFTKNCTEALNIVLMSIGEEGGHFIISDLEHNSDQSRIADCGMSEERKAYFRSKYAKAKAILLEE